MFIKPYPATHSYSAICKQLGSGLDAESFGKSSRSKLFDTKTFFLILATLKHLENWSRWEI